ncbi:S8 family serine peptidase [Stenotrophomonas sp. C3(2023)]|uniref:autotransporter domain-containing protein n=1 Tax=Stenotrophomonas sp. C3(2023) TaxID=3080277 RepID=UPI00293C46C4|nr:autotransporter domain-containing protein [Stenotrophomonas sp. C3(2023)]MDV3467559.1 S8 family serine peptidase [Stenotrophomonas sp. C3(2023)]
MATLACSAPAALAETSSEARDQWQRQRAQQHALHTRSLVGAGPAGNAANAPRSSPPLAAAGDRQQWRTPEFLQGGGLGMIKADAAYARGLSGTGIRLGVLDSGTWLDHPEFAGRDHRSILLQAPGPDGGLCQRGAALAGPDACYFRDGRDPSYEFLVIDENVPDDLRQQIEDTYGPAGLNPQDHGTHVGGIIAANRDGRGMHGVAFGALLTVANNEYDSLNHFFMQDGQLQRRDIDGKEMPDALVPVMFDRFAQDGTRAINNSWGIGVSATTLEELQEILASPSLQHFSKTYGTVSARHGMLQVWAAGNAAGEGTPDERPGADALASLPHALRELEPLWLSVVAVDDQQELDPFSVKCGLTASWCLAAPGSGIDSTRIGAADDPVGVRMRGDDVHVDVPSDALLPEYGRYGGTSMAAPHVTGALGLLFERFPYLDNAQVRDVLLTTATDLGASGVDEIYGWGLINLEKAIEGYGQLRVDTDVVMNQRAGGRKVWQGDAWDDWTNDIGGPGALTKSGIGWLRLSGDNTFNGALVREGILELDGHNTLTSAVQVDGGQLRLNGSLLGTSLQVHAGSALVSSSGVLEGSNLLINGGSVRFDGKQRSGHTAIEQNGMLGGTGTLSNTDNNGTLVPGDGLGGGTLKINGNYRQGSNGTLLASLAGDNPALLTVSGSAVLSGNVVAAPVEGQFYLGEQFNLLHAEGGISGSFASLDTHAFSPFLQFSLQGDASTLRVDVQRGASLHSAAVGHNQQALAAVLDTLPVRQGLPQPLTQLFPQQLGTALDGLSGELHAAAPLALAQSSRYVRDAVLARSNAGALAPQADAAPATVWVQAIGGATTMQGGAGLASARSNSTGLLAGAEYMLGYTQLGMVLGSGRSDVRQAQGRQARLRSDNRHVGLYASHDWGALTVGGGMAYSRHRIDSERQLQFQGFHDALAARQHGSTRQLFAEGSYRFGSEQIGLSPYLQVARVRVDLGDVRERGGAAALHGKVGRIDSTTVGTGLRFDKGLQAQGQDNSWLRLTGSLGYQRNLGDREGAALLGFNTGNRFGVASTAIARSAWTGELGISAWLTPRQQLQLGYSGQFASRNRDHALNASWSLTF